jgi:hypothetical protein
MEDHQGELVLEDSEPGGTRVKLIFATETRMPDRPDSTEQLRELSTAGHGA